MMEPIWPIILSCSTCRHAGRLEFENLTANVSATLSERNKTLQVHIVRRRRGDFRALQRKNAAQLISVRTAGRVTCMLADF